MNGTREYRCVIDKATDFHYRWREDTRSEDAFQLYIRNSASPKPPPHVIYAGVVDLRDVGDADERTRAVEQLQERFTFAASAQFVHEHQAYVEYEPPGTWWDRATGKGIYVPKRMLRRPWPPAIVVVVRWGTISIEYAK